MNIEKQLRDDQHALITVQVEADRLEGMKRRAASKLAKRVKIPGFRPGKAPYPVIVRQLGDAAILEEAIELLVDEIYPEIIKEAEIKPYGPGKLENITNTDPLTLEFSIPLEAETILGDYHSIQKPYEPGSVTDEDVAAVLEDLRENHAIVEPVERPAQEGDLVVLNLSATRSGSEDGQVEELIPERSTSVIIRPVDRETQGETDSSTDNDEATDEWPFPGFSRNLIGMASGDEKHLEYNYPEDSNYKTLQGAQAEFYIKVETVKSRQLPEVGDEFASTVGEFDTLDALQAGIRKTLESQARASYNENYDEEILDSAVEQTTYRYPPEVVEHEIETVIDEFRRRLERQGMDLDLYLKARNIDMKAFEEEVQPVAESRIKRALFLVEFGRAENVEVKPEELEREAYSTMDYLYNTLPQRDARKLSDRDVYTNIVGNLLADMMSRRSLARFRELSSGGLSKEITEDEAQEEEVPAESALVAEAVESDPASNQIMDNHPTDESPADDSPAG